MALALQDKLKRLLGQVRIVVEPGPGESQPTADNRTGEGRERNRRVEVFIKTMVTKPPPSPLPRGFDPVKAAEEAAEKIVPIRPETPEERLQRILKEPVPTLPRGRSFKEWLDRTMAERRVPKWLRDRIWRAIFENNGGLLSSLLSAAGFSDETQKSIIETARAAGEAKAR